MRIINEKFSSMDVIWYACLKTEAEGSIVFLTELSLLGFVFCCITGLLFLPNDTLRAEGIYLSYSRNFLSRFLPFSNFPIIYFPIFQIIFTESHAATSNAGRCEKYLLLWLCRRYMTLIQENAWLIIIWIYPIITLSVNTYHVRISNYFLFLQSKIFHCLWFQHKRRRRETVNNFFVTVVLWLRECIEFRT